jgi:hypothetical protein
MRQPSRFVPLALLVLAVLGGGLAVPAPAAKPAGPTYSDPAHVDDDFAFQGEYAGEATIDGHALRLGIQVVALGGGKFDVVAYPGGLPGDGWTPPEKMRGTGTRTGSGAAAVVALEGIDWTGQKRRGEIRAGAVVAVAEDGAVVAKFPRVERKSPTLGAKPPAGAVVICDGAGPVDEAATLAGARLTEDGLLMEGVTTAGEFGDAHWHLEFRLPYQPHDRGQGRGNSGAYFNGSYEVQMLDSFGLEGKDNECGGIYKVAPPKVNMCLPPLAWQTYDVDFTAPRFEGGAKVKNARVTVRHNGVVVHDDIEVPGITQGGPVKEERAAGPLHLQNHDNPVRYRNIWVLPKP